jgi:hypothetical protein
LWTWNGGGGGAKADEQGVLGRKTNYVLWTGNGGKRRVFFADGAAALAAARPTALWSAVAERGTSGDTAFLPT